MLNRKQVVTAGATLGIALATGFVMQNGDAVASFLTDTPDVPTETPKPTVVQSSILPIQSAPESAPEPTRVAALETSPEIMDTEPAVMAEPVEMAQPVESAEEVLACQTTIRGEAIAAAMVRLNLTSDCRPNERLTIQHSGMVFTTETDSAGMLTVEVPALNERARFFAYFSDEEGAVVDVDVPSLSFYDRVVLQWRGENALQLHALEFGAQYGEEGHVWSDAARDASTAATGQGGFITALGSETGDTALRAEVYSFPTRFITDAGKIDLSVEAEVTARNCAREIEAQSIQIRPDAEPKISELVLSVPGCDAVGDLLVLDSMIEDLTLASR